MGKRKKGQSCFFKNINKIDETLSRLINEKRERMQINKIRTEREVINSTGPRGIQG